MCFNDGVMKDSEYTNSGPGLWFWNILTGIFNEIIHGCSQDWYIFTFLKHGQEKRENYHRLLALQLAGIFITLDAFNS